MLNHTTTTSRALHWLLPAACIGLGALAGASFNGQDGAGSDQPVRFDEITVERINIVEPDGSLKLVIASSERQAVAVIDGVELMPDRTRPPGMIFFSETGDEIGGLTFHGNEYGRSGGITFDKHVQDQVVSLMHRDWPDGDVRRATSGLMVWDRPDESIVETLAAVEAARAIEDPAAQREAILALQQQGRLGATRMFAGRNAEGESTVDLQDARGRTRLRLVVADTGDARIEFLDEQGSVVKAIAAE